MENIKRMLPYQLIFTFVMYAAALADRRWALSYFLLMLLFPFISFVAAFFYAYRHGFSLFFWLSTAVLLLPLLLLYGPWVAVYQLAYLLLSLSGLGIGHFMRRRYRTLRVYAR